jgi:hypothetical protein
MPKLFLPLFALSFVLGWIGFSMLAKHRKFSRKHSLALGFLTGCACATVLTSPLLMYKEIPASSASPETDVAMASPVAAIGSATSGVTPGMLFYFRNDAPFGCRTKEALVKIYASAGKSDFKNMFAGFDSGVCLIPIPSDIQWKVDNIEHLNGIEEDVVSFHNPSETDDKWVFYTLIHDVSSSTLPTPAGSFLSTPRVTGASPGFKLKAGDIFYFNPKTAISCVMKEKLAELYTSAVKKDLTHFNHLVLSKYVGGCDSHMDTSFAWSVDNVEKVDGIDEEVVYFHYRENTDHFYTLIEFTGRKPFPAQVAAN